MNPELDNSLATFQGCCELVGVAKAQEYLRSRRAWEIKDWSSYQLDEEGKAIQAEMGGRFQVKLQSL
jgi:exportin-5